MKRLVLPLAFWSLAGATCTSTPSRPTVHPVVDTTPPAPASDAGASAAVARPRVSPPASGPARDVHLPAVRTARLPNGVALNLVEYHTLPVLHLRLTVRAGLSSDPANLPGLSSFTGDMLKEGTRSHTSAQLAETIEFVGGSLNVTTGTDSTMVSISVLRDHAETALTLLAEVLSEPNFLQTEIDKLKRREGDRLRRSLNDPGWQSRRAFYNAVYGPAHPYGHTDLTLDVLRRITRADLVSYHRQRYVGGNMFLVAVGDFDPAAFQALATLALGRLRAGSAPAITFPAVAPRTARQVVLVDRPQSPQSVVRIGHLGLRRRDEDFVPLRVANHLLGGGAASRLFMDLRELRSLTYGAYSAVGESVETAPYFANASVRTPVTGDAVHALYAHLGCVTSQAPPEAEMAQTRSYLIDSFPLSIETPANVADLVTNLRLYDLPDDYYDRYRARVAQVDTAGALAVAQRYIHPEQSLLVVVGSAEAPVAVGPLCPALAAPAHAQDTMAQQLAACAPGAAGDGAAAPPERPTQPLQEVLRAFGPVRVLNLEGQTVRELAATAASEGPLRTRCEDLNAPALQRSAHHETAGASGAPH
jgi:predicted Zn-dependent peptidase